MLTIYTDGSSLGNPGPGGRGVVILGEQYRGEDGATRQRKKVLSGGETRTTNNRMELQAMIQALRWLVKEELTTRDAIIFTDSMYVRDGLEKYLDQWIARGRKLANKKPVLNKDLREQLYMLKKACTNVKRDWVKAHASNKINNEVDVLARGEAMKIQAGLPVGYVGVVENSSASSVGADIMGGGLFG